MFYIHYSWSLALLSTIIYLIMILVARPWITWFNPRRNNIKSGIYFFTFLLIINSIFAFYDHDTYHYWEQFRIAGFYQQYNIQAYESVYNWLAIVVGDKYFLWRACIFVPACLFIYYTAKRLRLLNRNFLVVMILFGCFLAYTRAMLGHMVLLFGFVLLVNNESSKSDRIMGFILLFVSYFLHKSMYINLIFVLAACLIPFNRKICICSLIAFPFLTMATTYVVDYVLDANIQLNEGVGNVEGSTEFYLKAQVQRIDFNIIGQVRNIIEGSGLFLAYIYIYNRLYIRKYLNRKRDKVYFYLFRLAFWCTYVAYLFYFNQDVSGWIFHRFRYMGYFPLLFVLTKVISIENRSNWWIRWIIILTLMANLAARYSTINHWYHGLL